MCELNAATRTHFGNFSSNECVYLRREDIADYNVSGRTIVGHPRQWRIQDLTLGEGVNFVKGVGGSLKSLKVLTVEV